MSSYPPSDPTATLGHFKSMIELSASTQTILQGIGMISADTHAQQIVENLKKLSDQLHEADLSTLPVNTDHSFFTSTQLTVHMYTIGYQ
jgi:hypothetical protein